MSIQIACDQCASTDTDHQGMRLLLLTDVAWDPWTGARQPSLDSGSHVHWKCIPDYVARVNAERAAAEEPPF